MEASLSNLTDGTNGSGHGPGLGDIPEGYVACVFTYLTPLENCNLARLNRAFRGAASSDSAWESKQPQITMIYSIWCLFRDTKTSRKMIYLLYWNWAAPPCPCSSNLSVLRSSNCPETSKPFETLQPHHRAMVEFEFDEAKDDLGIGDLVANACDCGPFAFPIQWVFAWDYIDFAFMFGGKALLLESLEEGFLAKILVPEGSKDVPVGQPIAITVEDADDIQNLPANVVSGSEVKEDIPAPQNVKNEEGVQDTSFVGINTSELPPHIVVEMPALSPTMSQGNIFKWRKKEGDKIEVGDIICEIETDKATIEYEFLEEGCKQAHVG
ncbi:hypothetical protein C1H46_011681 [Malus baccata]|uniref:Lipoyl-binding domain-containing protein n=1 Tax=Malus baccata TaxID=106549 RepID=A0A540MVB8_MALBA|nr:hypothetical protein C1H46_011681 [Malus baccata]